MPTDGPDWRERLRSLAGDSHLRLPRGLVEHRARLGVSCEEWDVLEPCINRMTGPNPTPPTYGELMEITGRSQDSVRELIASLCAKGMVSQRGVCNRTPILDPTGLLDAYEALRDGKRESHAGIPRVLRAKPSASKPRQMPDLGTPANAGLTPANAGLTPANAGLTPANAGLPARTVLPNGYSETLIHGDVPPSSHPPGASPANAGALAIFAAWGHWHITPVALRRRLASDARTYPDLDLEREAQLFCDNYADGHYPATAGDKAGQAINASSRWGGWLAESRERRAAEKARRSSGSSQPRGHRGAGAPGGSGPRPDAGGAHAGTAGDRGREPGADPGQNSGDGRELVAFLRSRRSAAVEPPDAGAGPDAPAGEPPGTE